MHGILKEYKFESVETSVEDQFYSLICCTTGELLPVWGSSKGGSFADLSKLLVYYCL